MRVFSIQLKVVSLIVLSLLLTILVILYFTITNEKNNLLQASERTLAINTAILEQAIGTIMLNGEAPIAVRTVENLQKISELSIIDIYRANGEAAFQDYKTLDLVNQFQDRKTFLKTARTKSKRMRNGHFQEVVTSNTAVKVNLKDRESLAFYFPMINRPICRNCHGHDHIIRGVLHLEISIQTIYRQIEKASMALTAIFSIAGILICLFLIFFLRRIIIKPLMNIGETVVQVGEGNFEVEARLGSNDEFDIIAEKTNFMIKSLKDRTEQLQITQDVTILSLASLAETRDNETGAHIRRTQSYIKVMAEHLKSHPDFAEVLDEQTIDLIYKSAPLHDVGKVGIPDRILLKPGKLTVEEFEEMKKHTVYGHEAIARAEKHLGTTSFLRYAREIAYTHQEKWDGSGYPRGLKGEEIPLSGRLMAVADVYDALISKRVYKPAFPHDKAVQIIKEGTDSHFDPRLVEAFIDIQDDFKDIATRLSDDAYQ